MTQTLLHFLGPEYEYRPWLKMFLENGLNVNYPLELVDNQRKRSIFECFALKWAGNERNNVFFEGFALEILKIQREFDLPVDFRVGATSADEHAFGEIVGEKYIDFQSLFVDGPFGPFCYLGLPHYQEEEESGFYPDAPRKGGLYLTFCWHQSDLGLMQPVLTFPRPLPRNCLGG